MNTLHLTISVDLVSTDASYPYDDQDAYRVEYEPLRAHLIDVSETVLLLARPPITRSAKN